MNTTDWLFDGAKFAAAKFAAAVRDHRGAQQKQDYQKRVGVSARALRIVDGGFSPRVETFLRLCDIIGRAPGEFFVDAAPKA